MTSLQDALTDYPLFTKSGGINPNLLRPTNPFLLTDIYKQTLAFYGDSDSERIFNVFNERTLCLVCGKPTPFINFKHGYRPYCGNSCQTQSSLRKAAMKQTLMSRYGVEHALRNEAFKKKAQQTSLAKFGVESNNHKHLTQDTITKLNNPAWLIQVHKEDKSSLVDMAAQLGVSPKTVGNYLRKHKIPISRHFSQSGPEKRIVDMVRALVNTDKILLNSRAIIPPHELDIYVPTLRLAVEFNGRYWHAPRRFTSAEHWKQFHLTKEQECDKAGIRLVHLWEDYGNHSDIIERSILGETIANNYDLVLREVNWA